MKKFEDLQFKSHSIGNGIAARIGFDNGYGVSVVKFNGSYGFEDDLFELAVLHNDDITYNTDITDDAIGHLTELGVTDIMIKVQSL